MSVSPKARLIRDWVVTEWADKLCAVVEAITEERPVPGHFGANDRSGGPGGDFVLWQQKISLFSDPVLWVASSVDTCVELGRRVLVASGIDAIEREDAQNTFLELLSQSLAALGDAFSSHLKLNCGAGDGEQISQAPPDVEWVQISLQIAGALMEPLWIAVAEILLEKLAVGQEKVEKRGEDPAPTVDSPPRAPAPAGPSQVTSKTFELLLDVAMPVSISFGRTYMAIKDVLKLTTGSIVELDRGISEPVDVIVNNCVIARGEVVVVEGNYGVRIHQIASRSDRLRTGTAATQIKHALAGD